MRRRLLLIELPYCSKGVYAFDFTLDENEVNRAMSWGVSEVVAFQPFAAFNELKLPCASGLLPLIGTHDLETVHVPQLHGMNRPGF